MFFLEKEGLGQYLFAATSRGQANICFKIAKLMIKKFCAEFDLQEAVQITVPSIEHLGNNSVISAVSKEADSIEGKHASAASADEYHIHKTDDIVNNLKSGMGGRQQPLLLRITTPGTNLFSPCFNFYEYATSVLERRAIDERLFTIVFSIDDEDDPFDEDVWPKANPNLGVSPTWDFIRGQAKQAMNIGGYKMSDYLTKHMGIWVSNASRWIKDEYVNACYREYQLEGKKGGFAGLDLAYSKDLTAFGIMFDDGTFYARYFIPEQKLNSKEDGVDYTKWVEEGYITVTYGNDGAMTDYEVVKQVVIADMLRFGIRKLYYDPWNSNQLILDLEREGVKTGKYGQSPKNFTPVITALEEMIMKRQLTFYDPVTKWMLGNVKIKDVGSDLKKIVRDSKSNKIDGVMAMCMAKAAQMIEGGPRRKPQILILNPLKEQPNE
jgi:phage terminase large subunit-like protein